MKTRMSIEQFEQFLRNEYGLLTRQTFISDVSYVGYIKKAMRYLNMEASRFFTASLGEVKAWKINLMDNSAFRSLSPKYQADILSGYNAYIDCVRYKLGFLKIDNNQ
ncbi:MAG: hypothetical protein ACLQQ4_14640 [Bacteroidia bacterium]